jgi:heptaprenyl diphosphate synthase
MTRSTTSPFNLRITAQDRQIARLTAYAIGLHLVEAVLPSPLPGVKPGIANIVTLFVLYQHGFSAAAWVNILRIFAGGLLLGQFLSPTFLLSLSGGLSSLAILALAIHLPKRWFSPISISILGAIAHIAGQLILVRLWLIPHAGIAYLIPIFFSAALFFGLMNGLITQHLLKENN